MTVTHATTTRDALANQIDALVNTGAGTAVLRIRQSTTAVVNFNLQNPAFGDASSGVITLNGVPIVANAVAAGAAVDNFQLLDRGGAVVLSGSVTATGGGGDIEVTNTNIASGQECSLESLTYTAPA